MQRVGGDAPRAQHLRQRLGVLDVAREHQRLAEARAVLDEGAHRVFAEVAREHGHRHQRRVVVRPAHEREAGVVARRRGQAKEARRRLVALVQLAVGALPFAPVRLVDDHDVEGRVTKLGVAAAAPGVDGREHHVAIGALGEGMEGVPTGGPDEADALARAVVASAQVARGLTEQPPVLGDPPHEAAARQGMEPEPVGSDAGLAAAGGDADAIAAAWRAGAQHALDLVDELALVAAGGLRGGVGVEVEVRGLHLRGRGRGLGLVGREDRAYGCERDRAHGELRGDGARRRARPSAQLGDEAVPARARHPLGGADEGGQVVAGRPGQRGDEPRRVTIGGEAQAGGEAPQRRDSTGAPDQPETMVERRHGMGDRLS